MLKNSASTTESYPTLAVEAVLSFDGVIISFFKNFSSIYVGRNLRKFDKIYVDRAELVITSHMCDLGDFFINLNEDKESLYFC